MADIVAMPSDTPTHTACFVPRVVTNPRSRKDKLMALSSDVKLDIKSCLQDKYSDDTAVSNIHMGQRKLLLSEIQLLTEYYKAAKHPEHPTLVYVGSAPGTHILFLHELFPKVRFILYDGSRFDPGLLSPSKSSVFKVHNTYFTDSTCNELAHRMGKTPIVFVSDIRSDAKDAGNFENQVMWDLLSQRRWVERLKPTFSLLKFRLPFNLKASDTVKYLPGRLLFGIWPPPLSAETRLLVRVDDLSKPEVSYPYGPYESALFFHNKYTRSMCFTDALPDDLREIVNSTDSNYCGCYDCSSELLVYKGYTVVASLAGRPDLIDVHTVLDRYVKHAIANHAPVPKVVHRGQQKDAGDAMRKQAELSITSCKKQQQQDEARSVSKRGPVSR